MSEQVNLFGEVIVTDPILREQFIEPPFSVLDTKTGNWQRRKKLWKKLGIKSEIGRNSKSKNRLSDDGGSLRSIGGNKKKVLMKAYLTQLCVKFSIIGSAQREGASSTHSRVVRFAVLWQIN